jgi:hypothetical protein
MRVAVSIHVAGGGATPRRVVVSCDVIGCPVQVEPPAAERWRSDSDAGFWARERAVGWSHDPVRRTDYCPDHVEFSIPPVVGVVPLRPTAAIRDAVGNPLNHDEYAQRLRTLLGESGSSTKPQPALTVAQAEVVARLLDELAGVYRDEELGALARELSQLLAPNFTDQS